MVVPCPQAIGTGLGPSDAAKRVKRLLEAAKAPGQIPWFIVPGCWEGARTGARGMLRAL